MEKGGRVVYYTKLITENLIYYAYGRYFRPSSLLIYIDTVYCNKFIDKYYSLTYSLRDDKIRLYLTRMYKPLNELIDEMISKNLIE